MFTIDSGIANLLDRLSENLQVEYQQCINQLEFSSEFPAKLTECIGLIVLLRHSLHGLTSVTALQIELDGQTEWLAVTDVEYVRQHLADIHATVIAEVDLRIAIEDQYAGCACLTNLA